MPVLLPPQKSECKFAHMTRATVWPGFYLNAFFIRYKSLQSLTVHHFKSSISRRKQCDVGEVHSRVLYHLRENAEIWVAFQNGLNVTRRGLQDSIDDVDNSIACTLVWKNDFSSLNDNCLSKWRERVTA